MANSKWSDAFLDEKRGQMDPVADAVVDELFANGSRDEVNELLVHLTTNAQPIPEQLPASVRDYLDQTSQFPEWADPEAIRTGERVFRGLGPLCLLSLICVSLPVAYSNRRAVPVLATTQQLEAHTKRRILETAQLIVDVMREGGLAPDGHGVRAAQRVRLMHAAIRHLLLASAPEEVATPRHLGDVLVRTPWNPADGQPICQEDMGGTILTFSWIVIRSLDRMKQTLSPDDAQAYYHCWRVVGHFMGVCDELLPETVDEGMHLFRRMQERNIGPTDAGRVLTERVMQTTYELVRDRVTHLTNRHLPTLLVHKLNDEQTLKAIGVKPLGFIDRFVALPILDFLLELVSFLGYSGSSRFLLRVRDEVSRALVTELAALPRGDNRGLFAMPPDLLEGWTPPD